LSSFLGLQKATTMNKTSTIALLLVLSSLSVFSQDCEPTAFETLDIGNVSAGMLNGGDMLWDLSNSRYEVPKGSGKHSLFAGSFWMSGIDEFGILTNAAMTYRQLGFDYGPGPLCNEGEVYETGCSDFNRIWKVNQSDIDDQLAALSLGSSSISDLPDAVVQWPGKDNPHFNLFPLPIEKTLAPFVDVDGDNIYNPLAGDYPRINGDQGLWWVFNDLAVPHTETNGFPLGIEISVLAYAFDENGSSGLENHTFYEVNVFNPTGSFTEFIFGFWIDVDLGTFDDDFIGCNPDADMAISYNGDAFDEGAFGYGEDIPVVGARFLKGLTDDDGTDMGMTRFISYNNNFGDNGNPTQFEDYSNLLNGQNVAGNPILDPDGNEVDFLFPGNPSDPQGWSECAVANQPSDKRMLMSSGPTNLSSNERQTVHIALLWTQDVEYPCPDMSILEEIGDDIKMQFADILNNAEVMSSGECATAISSGIGDIENAFTIFPNPVVDHQLTVDLSLTNDGAHTVRLFNAAGVLLHTSILSPQSKVELDKNIPSGVYLLEISEGQRVLGSSKVVLL